MCVCVCVCVVKIRDIQRSLFFLKTKDRKWFFAMCEEQIKNKIPFPGPSGDLLVISM